MPRRSGASKGGCLTRVTSKSHREMSKCHQLMANGDRLMVKCLLKMSKCHQMISKSHPKMAKCHQPVAKSRHRQQFLQASVPAWEPGGTMATRPKLEPDVTLGELLLLARLAELLYDDGKAAPAGAYGSETGVSKTRIRNALLRIESALGIVEMQGAGRRTQKPNAFGRNIGSAARLVERLIYVARQHATDQDKLHLAIRTAEQGLERQWRAGDFDKAAS
ncbi:MAG: hypothetical protein KIT02_06720 [Devosia sp.]|uniref:hypothetical protein n=1 Tax=Devosia sp. TaxID=1871048 RepID=UPI0024C934A9|nr:hypothetical protein [Devosia sp.]UYO00890.1 MAG: hypothetical protein KIT02_06720 [Devosia sp.]